MSFSVLQQKLPETLYFQGLQAFQSRDGIGTFSRLYPSISRGFRPCPKIDFFAFTSLSTELHERVVKGASNSKNGF